MGIVAVPGLNLYRVQFNGGGMVPDSLRGHFTSTAVAQKSIDTYLNNRKGKK